MTNMCVIINLFSLVICFMSVSSLSKIDQLRTVTLPPCRGCKTLVESFKNGLTQTEKGKFEGGDAAWEEEKLGSYAKSEIRLVEIQENLCKDIEEGRNQCFSLAEQYDNLLEEWWFSNQITDLYEWLCVAKLKYCCSENHFGPDCLQCPGYPNVCSNNGKCKGAGTRKGNGQCVCDTGYEGDLCSECALRYYQSYKDEKHLLCSKCHKSCADACTGAGNKACYKCAEGWQMDSERGCLDINECAFEDSACSSSQFCVNTEGSYKCLECDRACSGCSGDGPDMCEICAPGYTFLNNMCMDTSQEQRSSYINVTRYLTYVGLCVATCIILQRNVVIAAIVGLAVAMYISVSEYMLSTNILANSPDTVIDPDKILQSVR